MSDLEKIQDFENQKIHTVWVEDEEEWFSPSRTSCQY